MIDREEVARTVGKTFDCYELCFIREKMKRYESFEEELYGLVFREEEGVALRAIQDNRLVFSYTYETGEKAARALLENAVGLLPFMDSDSDVAFPALAPGYPTFDAYDHAGLAVDDREKTSRVIALEESMRGHDKRIVQTRNCELQEVEIDSFVVNSNGLRAEACKTIYTLGGLCVAKNGEEVPWYDWKWSHALSDLEP